MKRSTLFTAVAALALVSPLAIASASAQQDLLRNDQPLQNVQYQRPQQEDRDDRDTRNGRDDRADRGDRDDRDGAQRGDARDRREVWRDGNRNARWNRNRHNGYYENTRWTYGEPAADRYGRPGFALGYQPWSIGQRIGSYRSSFQQVDYRRAQLPAPTRGQSWVRDDRGDYLLINRQGRVMRVVISGYEPRDRRQSWRDARSDARWDESRHNGYYRNNQWTYGPPPEGRYGRDDIVYGYQPWQRGQRLGYYQGRYQQVDYRTNRSLRQPPRGYHWVRNDSGDFLLAAIAGGLIAQVILNSSR